MKAKLFVGTLLGLLVFAIQARAQNEYLVNFRGTAQTTDDSGAIVSRPINNTTYIQEAVNNTGQTNTQHLQLVYHVNGTENNGIFGDTVEVLNSTNHTSIYTNFSIYSGGSFGPQIISADETQAARLCDIFTAQATSQSGEDQGTGLVNERSIAKNGVVKKLIGSGTLLYVVLPTGTNAEQICNVTFTLSRALP